MVKSTCYTLGLAAALAMFGAGCGDDPVPVDDYANDLCTARGDFSTAIRELEEGAQLDEFLDGAVDASEQLQQDVEAAGVPDIDGGEDVADAFRNVADEIRSELEDAQESIGELPTDDFISDLGHTFASINERIAEVDAPELERALEEARACRR